MDKTLHEFAELVGQCLARRWLREADETKNETITTQPPAHRNASNHAEDMASPTDLA